MDTSVTPNPLQPGDRVAILSPSLGLPEILPLPFDLGLQRLREDFDLEPVEYPTTRTMGSSPQARANDVNAAFADPSIKGIISSIGGDDQITVLPYLDAELIAANPKPFFGFSDCMNLLAYLDRLGIVGYHGGTVMTALGRPGAMHTVTETSLRAALFSRGQFTLPESKDFTDRATDWEDPATFDEEPAMVPSDGWRWHNADRVVEGRTWGGNLEILSWLAMANQQMPAPEELAGRVLFLETSEELPDHNVVYRILRNFGERGFLGQCAALLWGRPKAWNFDKPLTVQESNEYAENQLASVSKAMEQYAPDTPIVFNVDFGHTDPQVVLPYGGPIQVDGLNKTITVIY